MKSSKSSGGLVYSTELGRTCPECRQAIAQCVCGKKVVSPSADGIVRVSRETKGRKGKGVTVVKGVPAEEGVDGQARWRLTCAHARWA